MKKIYKSDFTLLDERLIICSTDSGLCSLSHDVPNIKGAEWITGKEAEQKNQEYVNEMLAYATGTVSDFNWTYDLTGTPFQLEVWDALRTIPYGATCTYSDIAEMIGRPRAVRAVGGAIGRNPVLISIPCHRVIGKNGKLTGFSSGLHLKRRLLDIEAVPYND
ncbi:methylated-DNA--[protein]-cysteine S-methyltransferase [Macrococcus brunensis]|uniref:methylated-DNA--[protein]-cysteine S-methyltransferase n=1 Tax=Macrococcus brunensis TaxID=198483 RepID=UPI0023B26BFD|nr:methylated-DNA--[protein]-cysteine S-methyltransferase [Macrococcus brunensis]